MANFGAMSTNFRGPRPIRRATNWHPSRHPLDAATSASAGHNAAPNSQPTKSASATQIDASKVLAAARPRASRAQRPLMRMQKWGTCVPNGGAALCAEIRNTSGGGAARPTPFLALPASPHKWMLACWSPCAPAPARMPRLLSCPSQYPSFPRPLCPRCSRASSPDCSDICGFRTLYV